MNPRTRLAIGCVLATAALPLAADAHDEKHARHHGEKHAQQEMHGKGNAWFGDDARAPHTWLGVSLQRLSGDLAEALDLKEDTGVLIGQVMEDSPAEKAGLESGDVVLSVDGEKTGTPDALRDLVRSRAAGDEIKVRVNRNGAQKTVRVELAERKPERGVLARAFDGARQHFPRELRFQGTRAYLGVMTQELSGDLAAYFGAENGGALVTEVVEDSPAASLGLRAGDVIVSVDEAGIETPADLRREVATRETEGETEIVWIRDKREKRGRVQLEVREADTALGMGEGRRNMRWFGEDGGGPDDRDIHRMLLRLDEDGNRQLVKRFRGADEEGVRELMEELRSEIEELREEVQGLKGE